MPAAAFLLLALGCSGVTPLTNKIAVGQEAFVIGVGEGSDGQTDLYAAPAQGGRFVRLTFNRAEERLPRLDPNGTRVAFLRRAADPAGPWSLVVLDLLSYRESSVALPAEGGEPVAVGWSKDGSSVVVRSKGYVATPAGPSMTSPTSVSPDSAAWADSATAELLGEPPAARIAQCPETSCVISREGDTTRLEGASGPIGWGGDSLGYFTSSGWEIRPLMGGRARRPAWTSIPAGIRQLTYSGGALSSRP